MTSTDGEDKMTTRDAVSEDLRRAIRAQAMNALMEFMNNEDATWADWLFDTDLEQMPDRWSMARAAFDDEPGLIP